MLEKAERRNGISGSKFADGKRMIGVGLRTLDQETRRAGYQMLKKLVGPESATRAALLQFAMWQEKEVGLENTSELYRENVATIRLLFGR